jgi:hypothetical protein
MLQLLNSGTDFLWKTTFSDEAIFPMTRKVNKQNLSLWGSDHPDTAQEHISQTATPSNI